MAEIQKPSKEDLKLLRNRLPQREGYIKKISEYCLCSPSKVSRVLNGHTYDLTVITTCQRVADEFEKNCLLLAEEAAKMVLSAQK